VFKDVYEKGIKTPDIQLIERFDPSLRTEAEFGKSSSRSVFKDISDMTYAFDFRRTMEFEASMELFWGAMYNKYIDQNGESITYAEAWTSDENGKLILKEGIDPNYSFDEVFHSFKLGETLESIAEKYNISVEALKYRSGIESVSKLIPGEEIRVGDASEFKRMKLLLQGLNKKVTGSLDKFDTAQAEKYIEHLLSIKDLLQECSLINIKWIQQLEIKEDMSITGILKHLKKDTTCKLFKLFINY
jgi:hypothetical protein